MGSAWPAHSAPAACRAPLALCSRVLCVPGGSSRRVPILDLGPTALPRTAARRTFLLNRERAVDYLNMLERLYVFDGFAGWDPQVRCWLGCRAPQLAAAGSRARLSWCTPELHA